MPTCQILTDNGTAGLPAHQDAADQAIAGLNHLPQISHERIQVVRNILAREGHESVVQNGHARLVYLYGELIAGRVPQAQQYAWLAGRPLLLGCTPASQSLKEDTRLHAMRKKRDWTRKECAVLSKWATVKTTDVTVTLAMLLPTMTLADLDEQVRPLVMASEPRWDDNNWLHVTGWKGSFAPGELMAKPGKPPKEGAPPLGTWIMDLFGG